MNRLGGGGKFWSRGPNLPPFTTFCIDLSHFILKLLNFDIYFLFYVYLYIYLVGGGGQNILSECLGVMTPCPLDTPMSKAVEKNRL